MSTRAEESYAYFRTLGIHLAQLRKDRGMTQAEVARILGVSQQTVFAYELGDRRVSVLMMIKLADVFSVPVQELIGIVRSQLPSKGRLSPSGIRHAERFGQLSKRHQRFVAQVIDVLLEMKASASSITSK